MVVSTVLYFATDPPSRQRGSLKILTNLRSTKILATLYSVTRIPGVSFLRKWQSPEDKVEVSP